METQFVVRDFNVQTNEYEVIGTGPMIYTPQQVGDWWVMPAQEYQGKIPAEAQRKLAELLNKGVVIKGLLVADDMRKIEAEREKKRKEEEAELQRQEAQRMEAQRLEAQRQEERRRSSEVATNIGNGLLSAFGLFFQILLGALLLDPMYIAVLDDGRWICLGSWYE